jgi:hypothetical protein
MIENNFKNNNNVFSKNKTSKKNHATREFDSSYAQSLNYPDSSWYLDLAVAIWLHDESRVRRWWSGSWKRAT